MPPDTWAMDDPSPFAPPGDTGQLEGADARPPEYSDESLALRFSAKYGSDAAFTAQWGQWFWWSGLSPVGVLITGGTAETYEGGIYYGVPKIVLVSRLQCLLHEGRLKIHKDLADAPVLVRELQDFRCEFTPSGALTFNARIGRHDDLVLALAIATWRAYRAMMAGWAAYELARRLAGGVEAPRTVIGVDIGQSRDPTAIAVVRRVPAATVTPEYDDDRQRSRAMPQPGSVEYEQWRQEQQQRA